MLAISWKEHCLRQLTHLQSAFSALDRDKDLRTQVDCFAEQRQRGDAVVGHSAQP